MKKIAVFLLLFLLPILAGGCGTGDDKSAQPAAPASSEKKQAFRIVTSFYPVYIDVINIAGGVEGVEVINMTKPQTGCLHDYQLLPEDMKTLETADVFVVNGLGMESFLEKVTGARKDLKIIDASQSDKINPIKEDDEINPHVWMSITYSIAQVKEITSKLCEADPAHADQYKKNALDYVMKLEALRDEMHAKLDNLPNKEIVTFHEAFPYFAKEFKLDIEAVIEREPGTEPTPQELEEIIEEVREMPHKVLFTEPQYSPAAAETIARETGAKIYTLDPVVTGEANDQAKDAYLNTMRKNAETLVAALQ